MNEQIIEIAKRLWPDGYVNAKTDPFASPTVRVFVDKGDGETFLFDPFNDWHSARLVAEWFGQKNRNEDNESRAFEAALAPNYWSSDCFWRGILATPEAIATAACNALEIKCER